MRRLWPTTILALSGPLVLGGYACSSQKNENAPEQIARVQGRLTGPGSQTGTGGGNGGGGGRQLLQSRTGGTPKSGFHIVTPADVGPNAMPGYRHTFSSSLSMRGGPIVTETDIDGVTRYSDANGVFVEMPNGYSAFALHGRVWQKYTTPFASAIETHNQRVIGYFVGAGLPAEQMGDVDGSANVKEYGTATSTDVHRQLLGHTTVIRRVVDGVPVVSSFAWAEFNGDGVVVGERVWWPPLSGSVRDEAAQFKALIADPTSRASFIARLPVDAQGGNARIAIHHSVPIGEKWYEHVTWDVAVGDGTRSFDMSGQELRMVGWTDAWTPPPNPSAK